MKLTSILMVILLLLAACAPVQPVEEAVVEQNGNAVQSPLEIGEGPTCPAYTPKGQVVYESEWTGEYPEIEQYDKDYATATFGMG